MQTDQDKNFTEQLDSQQVLQNEEENKKGVRFKPTSEQDKDLEEGVFENALLTQAFFSRYQLMDYSCTCVAIMGIVLSAITYELEYEQRLTSESKTILWAIMISCILNALFTIIRYQSYIDYKIVRKEYSKKVNLWNSGLIMPCMVEFILVLIHPSPFLVGKRFNFQQDWDGSGGADYFYYYNEILAMLGITKSFLVLRTILQMTRWYSNRAYRVCEMYGCEPTLLFICKCSMKFIPYTFISVFYLVVVIFFGIGLHISDSALNRGGETGFNSYLNSFWCVIVTMTTVGYGDFYPYSLIGRALIFFVCIIGTFMTSLMVLSMNNTLETTSLENRAICILDKLEQKGLRDNASARVLTSLAKISMGFKKKKLTRDKKEYKDKRKALLEQIKKFAVYKEAYKQIQDENLIQEMQRQFELIQKDMKILKQEQQCMLKKKIKVMKKYQMDEETISKYKDYIDPALNSTDGSCGGITTDSDDSEDDGYEGNYRQLEKKIHQRQQTIKLHQHSGSCNNRDCSGTERQLLRDSPQPTAQHRGSGVKIIINTIPDQGVIQFDNQYQEQQQQQQQNESDKDIILMTEQSNNGRRDTDQILMTEEKSKNDQILFTEEKCSKNDQILFTEEKGSRNDQILFTEEKGSGNDQILFTEEKKD